MKRIIFGSIILIRLFARHLSIDPPRFCGVLAA
jgi:hypothetical protein